ncbi:hypothetical protein [Streptomyces pseudovenezuelae]|uniref:hypothetical protein n=1 Tax=Streptomyces pseudovenezuelae TaxID=67350 RepID=UPI00371DC8AA
MSTVDERYDVRTDPRDSVRVPACADESSSYEGGGTGTDFHRTHPRGGITWAARRERSGA